MVSYTVDSLRGVVHVGDFEAAVFVACREDECALMGVFQMSWGGVGGLHERDVGVVPIILIYVGLDFRDGVYDLSSGIGQGERYLLMALVGVDVGIASHRSMQIHAWFYDAEAGDGNGGFSMGIVFVIVKIYLHAIVARGLELYVVVREVESIVRVEHGSPHRVGIVLEGLIVESVHVVHFVEIRWGPVCIAVYDLVMMSSWSQSSLTMVCKVYIVGA